jgi:hypothetical protein
MNHTPFNFASLPVDLDTDVRERANSVFCDFVLTISTSDSGEGANDGKVVVF